MSNVNENVRAMKLTALIIASISSFITPFLGSSMNIALPTVAHEFALDAVFLSWVVTSYLLATAIFLVPFGRIADIYGRKKIFQIGMVVFTIASLLAAGAQSAYILIFARIWQGIGSAMIFSTGMAILISVYPPGERGRALGINVAAVYLGLSLGPTLGGLLTHFWGWRSIFLACVPLCVVVILLVYWKLKAEWIEAGGENFDLAGSLIYGCAILALMYGFTNLSGGIGLWLLLLGAAGLCLFIRWELKAASPVLDIKIFQNNISFTFSNLAALINYSATSASVFILSLYLQYIRGFNEFHTGLILVSQPLMQVIFSPFAGKLSDRIEPRLVASVGMTMGALGLALLIFINETTPLWFVVASLLFLGFGFALFSSPNTNAIMSSVLKKYYGVASGTLSTMRLMGQTFSMGILTLILSLYIGRKPIIPHNYHLFVKCAQVSFAIFTVLCVLGIFASLARGNMRAEKD